MNILIVDDELPARERLVRMIDAVPDCEVVGEAVNGKNAIEQAEALQPDVILMDIRMPGLDGIEAARHLSGLDQPPAIIFTTAFGEHALEAFETHAVAYLLKPVRQQKLEEALAQAQQLNRAQLLALSDDVRTHICARVRGELQLIPVEDVVFFRAEQKYVVVRHLGGEVLIEESLKALEEEFGGRVLRLHRNALAFKSHIKGLKRNAAGTLELSFRPVEDSLEVSRRHAAEVRAYVTKAI